MLFHPVRRRAPTCRTSAVVTLSTGLLATGVAIGSAASPPPSGLPDPYGTAANGALVYAVDGDLVVADDTGGQPSAIITGPANDSQPSFSRDGTRIAFLREEDGQHPRLMIADADGSHVIALSDGTDLFDWSPGGDRLTANHDVDGRPWVSVVAADAT